MKKNGWIRSFRTHYNLYIMVTPFVVGILVFCYFPMYGVVVAFQDYDIMKGFFGSKFVGFEHFIAFANDPYFFRILKNTVLLGLYTFLWGFWPPIFLALALNELKHMRFKKITQTISYLPHFISIVVIVGIVFEVLSSYGIVNQLLTYLGFDKITFFIIPGWFRSIYVSITIWQAVGWGSIIYLAALTGVSPEQYESAVIDGATRLQQAIHITIPTIMPVIRIMLIFAVPSLVAVSFELIYLIYNPATYSTADVIPTYVFRRGIQGLDFSFGAAVGVAQSVIGFILLVIANWISKKTSGDGLW